MFNLYWSTTGNSLPGGQYDCLEDATRAASEWLRELLSSVSEDDRVDVLSGQMVIEVDHAAVWKSDCAVMV